MSFLDERKALTREKRLSTLSHYDGTFEAVSDLVQGTEIKQRIRTLTQNTYDEILYAIQVLGNLEDTAVIVHGAVGCAASGIYYNQLRPLHWYSTNLNERETILGGDEKLRKAVLRAYEETTARLIFIVGTPVVAINNDDVNSVILEMEEELDIRLVSIYTDGFKSKTPVSGYDIVLHSLLRHVIERGLPEQGKEDFINVVTLSENRENIVAIVKLLRELGISFQLLPQYAGVEAIKRSTRARATITLNPDEGSYFAEELQEVFGIPYIKTSMPIGPRGTRHFIRKLARELGILGKAQDYIEEQEDRVGKLMHKKPLGGKTVFLDINLAAAIHFTDFVERLGGTVSGISVPYIDLNNRENLAKLDGIGKGVPFLVANGQPYEKANVLAKKPADYYIVLEGNVAFSAAQGSIPISLGHAAFLGYEGIEQFLHQLERAASGGRIPDGEDGSTVNTYYKPAWLKKSSNWYVKQEVK